MNDPKRCQHDYIERDGTPTHCTREANHLGACYWPQLPEWRRRAMQAVQVGGRITAVKEVK